MGRIPLRLALDSKGSEDGGQQEAPKRPRPSGGEERSAGSFTGGIQRSPSNPIRSPLSERGASTCSFPAIPLPSASTSGNGGPTPRLQGGSPRAFAAPSASSAPVSYAASAASAASRFGSNSSNHSASSVGGVASISSSPGAGKPGGKSGWALLHRARITDGGATASMAAAVATAAPLSPPPPDPASDRRASEPLSGQALVAAAMSSVSHAERQLQELAAGPPAPPMAEPQDNGAAAAAAAIAAQYSGPPLRRPALAAPHHVTYPPPAPPHPQQQLQQQPNPPRQGGTLAALLQQRQLIPPPPRSPNKQPHAGARPVATPPFGASAPRLTPGQPLPPPPVGLMAKRRSSIADAPAELGAAAVAVVAASPAVSSSGAAATATADRASASGGAADAGTADEAGPQPDPRTQPLPTPQQPLMAVLRNLAELSTNQLTGSFDSNRQRHSMYDVTVSPPVSPPPFQPPPEAVGFGMDSVMGATRRRASDSNAYIAPALAGGGAAALRAPPAITAAAMRAIAGMQELDEYSLVAAARHRLRRAALTHARSASVQPHGSSGGGAAAGVGAAGGLAGVAAMLAGASRKGGGLGAHTSLRTLLTGHGQAAADPPPLQGTRSLSSLPLLLATKRSGPHADAETHGTPQQPHSPPSPGGAAAKEPPSEPTTPTLPPVAQAGRNGALSRSITGLGGVSVGGGAAAALASARSTASSPGGAVLAPGRMAAGPAAPPPADQQQQCSAGGGPVDEAAAAAAAVRALATRFGTVLPAEGLMEAEAELAFRDRSRRLMEALVAANPAAYQEEAAEAAEAAYRALSERAKYRLKVLLEEASTGEAPWRQLEESLRDLTSNRPFFLPPVVPRPKFERPHLEAPKATRQVAWSADDSIFAQRKKENEARDLYDTDKVRAQQLALDWRRIVTKSRFRRMIAKGDAGVRQDGQHLDEELGEVREELERQGNFIRSAFTYYSMVSGSGTSSDVLQIGANAWLTFCYDAGIITPNAARGCTAQDMQTIFVAVNFEEESETVEADANDDDAMVRFEFMEGLVRAAFGKFITSKRMTDASDATGALLEEIVNSPNLPPEARVDANEFRRNRFYTAEVEEVIKEYWDLLSAMFKLYKARDRAKYFWPEHWFAFLEANQLLGLATGVERREAKLIYAWSQALVTDELRRRQRAVSLTLWDFIEAVARLADLISAPDHEFIIEFFVAEGQDPPELERLTWEYYKLIGDAGTELKRESAELVAVPTRPLSTKLRLLLEYLTCSLREAWGGSGVKDVAAKVAKMATYLSGGIEMG